MMKKVATIAALAMIAPKVMGQCATNWIMADVDVEGLGDTTNSNAALDGSADYDICASFTTGTGVTCCTADEVNTFQTKADDLVETLTTAVKKRDQYVMDRRGDVLGVRDSLNSIQESITKLADGNTSVSGLDVFFEAYTSQIETFTENFDELKAGFVTLQKNRVTCFNALVRSQVTIWCAACSAGLDGITVTDATSGSVAPGTAIQDYLAEACNAYVTSAVEQSGILALYAVADSLAVLASALSKIANNDLTGAASDLQEFITEYEGIDTPTDNLEKVAYSPGTCTAASCEWATSLLSTGILNTDLATVGGSYTAASSRLLEGRILQTVDADPEDEAAGITVAFPENPGEVDNDQNSAVRNGAIACAITALAALF